MQMTFIATGTTDLWTILYSQQTHDSIFSLGIWEEKQAHITGLNKSIYAWSESLEARLGCCKDAGWRGTFLGDGHWKTSLNQRWPISHATILEEGGGCLWTSNQTMSVPANITPQICNHSDQVAFVGKNRFFHKVRKMSRGKVHDSGDGRWMGGKGQISELYITQFS